MMKTWAMSMLTLGVASAALADGGLALGPGGLTPEAQQRLQEQVETARLQHPQAFQGLAAVIDRMPELDARKRGRLAPITQTLRLLGEHRLFPILSVLALEAPAVSMSPSATLSLKIGLIEAVGELRDVRAAPVLRAILFSPQAEASLYRSAAEALGRLGSASVAQDLIQRSSQVGAHQVPVLAGMGSCRREEVAQRLVQVATGAQSEELRLAAIRGLSDVGNAWGWETEPSRAAEVAVRNLAAHGLVQAFVEGSPQVRLAASKALVVVDAPATRRLLRQAREQASGELKAALDQLSSAFKLPR